MYKSVVIENFRCFKRIKLDKLRRLNVIVGKNGSGKTSLLEAMFLSGGTTPEIATRLRQWRGYDGSLQGTFEQLDQALWADFFYSYDMDRQISIQASGSGNYNRFLSINYDLRSRARVVSVTGKQTTAESGVELAWGRDSKSAKKTRPKFTGEGYTFPDTVPNPVHTVFFAVSNPFNTRETANRFSIVDTEKRAAPFISAMQKMFPFIEGISLQSHFGTSMLHAEVAGIPRKIPLNAISVGVNKVAQLLLAISEQEKSVVYIDEIENGLHYSILPSLWKTIFEFADARDVQVFASTHSRECLLAIASVADHHKDGVSMIRTELTQGGVEVKQFVSLSAVRTVEPR